MEVDGGAEVEGGVEAEGGAVFEGGAEVELVDWAATVAARANANAPSRTVREPLIWPVIFAPPARRPLCPASMFSLDACTHIFGNKS